MFLQNCSRLCLRTLCMTLLFFSMFSVSALDTELLDEKVDPLVLSEFAKFESFHALAAAKTDLITQDEKRVRVIVNLENPNRVGFTRTAENRFAGDLRDLVSNEVASIQIQTRSWRPFARRPSGLLAT